MDTVVKGIPNTITYIDDLLIYGQTEEETISTLEKVLARFRQHNLKVNLDKSNFLQTHTEYLGHTLSHSGIAPGREKTEAIKTAQPPVSVKQLKSFLGIVNYFRSFIPNYAQKASKLYALTRKDSTWKGGPLPDYAIRIFHKIKNEIAETVPRALPRSNGKFHLYVDGSLGDQEQEGGLGAHLMQEDDKGNKATIAFASRQLKAHEKNYSAFLPGIAGGGLRHRIFLPLLNREILCSSYRPRPLTALSAQHKKTLHRLHALLNEHSFEIRHIPGKNNPVADFLSRCHGPARKAQPGEEAEEVAAVQAAAADTVYNALVIAQRADPVLGPIHSALMRGQEPPFPSNLGRYRDRVVLKGNVLCIILPPRAGVPDDERPRALLPSSLRKEIMQAAHGHQLAGHQGANRTAERIREQFWWPALDADVARFVQTCTTCQATSNKDAHHQPQYENFPLAQGPNHRLHVDLFGPIKDKEGGQRYVLGMTDAFTKILRLKALRTKTADEVAKAIWTDWMAIYGVPKVIVSDQGREFVNQLQKTILDLLQVQHRTTTPYHPVCNQMQEHQNKQLAHYLRCALHDAKRSSIDWEYYLPALMLAHNTAVNKATKQAPFRTMFGYDARLPLWPDISEVLQGKEFELPPAEKDSLYGWLEARQRARKAAYDSQIHQRDTQEPPPAAPGPSFKARQLVWHRLHTTNEANKKFAPKWEKAIIVERITQNTYKIKRTEAKRKKFVTVNGEHLKPRRESTDADSSSEEEEDPLSSSTSEEEEEVEESPPPPPDRWEEPSDEILSGDEDEGRVGALRIQYKGQWMDTREYLAEKGSFSHEELAQLQQALDNDPNPDYRLHLRHPGQGIIARPPGAQLPILPRAPGIKDLRAPTSSSPTPTDAAGSPATEAAAAAPALEAPASAATGPGSISPPTGIHFSTTPSPPPQTFLGTATTTPRVSATTATGRAAAAAAAAAANAASAPPAFTGTDKEGRGSTSTPTPTPSPCHAPAGGGSGPASTHSPQTPWDSKEAQKASPKEGSGRKKDADPAAGVSAETG